jgi:hypothetical protein
MMEQVKINGVRLNKNFIQVIVENISQQDTPGASLCQILASKGINLVSMSLNTMGNRSFFSGTVPGKHLDQIPKQDGHLTCHPKVCTISIYPHNYKLQVLGFLLYLFGKHRLSFQQLVSSNAMLTFVVDQNDCAAAIDVISKNFDLPESCAPFEQEENIELTRFLKKKYPETRATYVEEKIKTYGIALESDLNLCSYMFSFDQLAEYGQKIRSMKDKFFHVSAYMARPGQTQLFLLTNTSLGIPVRQTCKAELLSFYGPHFGDRHSIINRALNCLSDHSISVLQAGCTGASIGIILAKGTGKDAKKALTNVFEMP